MADPARVAALVVSDTVFEVEHMSLGYPARHGQPAAPILTDISFAVSRGASLTLVGPSGSGKSTLLRCLNRLAEPTQGCVRFYGHDITSLDPLELRRRAALVLQTPVLFEGTVRDNLRMQPAAARAGLSEAHLAHALTEVGLDPGFLNRDGATLSGGEKQRVTISRALLADPEALLLDEPTAALDPPNVAVLVETISRLRQSRGLTIVVVTHQPELMHRLGGDLLYLVKGRPEAYERTDGVVTNGRLRAFLGGERC
jgi:putative ABC transport system ATP-binding protein